MSASHFFKFPLLIKYIDRVYFQDPSYKTGTEDIGLFSELVLKKTRLYWQSIFSGPVLTGSAKNRIKEKKLNNLFKF